MDAVAVRNLSDEVVGLVVVGEEVADEDEDDDEDEDVEDVAKEDLACEVFVLILPLLSVVLARSLELELLVVGVCDVDEFWEDNKTGIVPNGGSRSLMRLSTCNSSSISSHFILIASCNLVGNVLLLFVVVVADSDVDVDDEGDTKPFSRIRGSSCPFEMVLLVVVTLAEASSGVVGNSPYSFRLHESKVMLSLRDTSVDKASI